MTGEVKGRLNFDVEDASKSVGDFFSGFSVQALGLDATFSLLERGFGLVKNAITAVVDTASELASVAEANDAAERRFLNLAQQRYGAVSGLLEQTQEFNEALEDLTGIQDSVTIGLQSQLIAMGVYRGDIEKATLAVVGIGQAHGKGLQEAVTIAAKLFTGNVDVLKELGVNVRTVNDGVDHYVRLARLAQEQGRSLTGQTAIMTSEFVDLKEELGRTVSNSQELARALGDIAGFTRALTAVVRENRPEITAGLDAIGQAARFVFFGIGDYFADLELQVFETTQLLNAQQKNLPNFTPPPPVLGPALPPGYEEQQKLRKRIEEAEQKDIETRNVIAAQKYREQIKAFNAQVDADMVAAFDRRKAIREQLRDIEIDEAARRRAALVQQEIETNEVLHNLQVEAFDAELAIADERENEKIERMWKAHEQHLSVLNTFSNNIIDQEKLADKVRSGELTRTQAELLNIAGTGLGLLQGAVAQSIGTVVAGLVQGRADIGDALSGIFSGVLNTMGDTLIGMSVAAGALALLSLIPFFGEIAGPPGMSLGAAGIALAAGVALKGFAAAMGGGGGGGGGASTPSAAGAGGGRIPGVVPDASGASDQTRRDAAENDHINRLLGRSRGSSSGTSSSTTRGGTSTGGGSGTTIVNNFHNSFRGAIVSRSEDRLARDLSKLHKRQERLAPRARDLVGASSR